MKVCGYHDGCPPDGPVCSLCAHLQSSESVRPLGAQLQQPVVEEALTWGWRAGLIAGLGVGASATFIVMKWAGL